MIKCMNLKCTAHWIFFSNVYTHVTTTNEDTEHYYHTRDFLFSPFLCVSPLLHPQLTLDPQLTLLISITID